MDAPAGDKQNPQHDTPPHGAVHEDSTPELSNSQAINFNAREKNENGSVNTSESLPVSTGHDEDPEVALYQRIESYDWENDNVYQQAIQHMSTTTQLEPSELELRAKCFYWVRKFKTDVDYPKYRNWKLFQNALATGQSTSSEEYLGSLTPSTNDIRVLGANPYDETCHEPSAPYPQNFAEVAEMITTGRGHLLPGVKEIPPTILADKITPPTKELRKKPWEKDGADLQVGGMFGDRRDILIIQE